MNHYYWSIPAVCAMYVLYAYLMKQNNVYQTAFWFWAMSIVGAFPLWSIVSKYSKHLLFDTFIYDFCMLVAQTATLIILGSASGFSTVQWFGLGLCVAGLLLIRIGL